MSDQGNKQVREALQARLSLREETRAEVLQDWQCVCDRKECGWCAAYDLLRIAAGKHEQ